MEVRYRPPIDEDGNDVDEADAIAEAVEDLLAEGKDDVLVFLSGEREIRDAAEMLTGRLKGRADLLPLYARLASTEQQKVFKPSPQGRPRVILKAGPGLAAQAAPLVAELGPRAHLRTDAALGDGDFIIETE